MNNIVDDVLSDLYTDKITIKDACKLLNKTRNEVWNLLDSFEYSPTSEDVIRACEIEQESMRAIDNSLHNITTKKIFERSDLIMH